MQLPVAERLVGTNEASLSEFRPLIKAAYICCPFVLVLCTIILLKWYINPVYQRKYKSFEGCETNILVARQLLFTILYALLCSQLKR